MQIIDVSKDPYGQKYYGRKNRKTFEQLKRTPAFKRWREQQFKLQQGRCAYCKIPLKAKNIVTHIDHIQPLRFDGTNGYDNLLLSCRRCNTKKWIATNRVLPEWVKNRRVDAEKWSQLTELRREQKRQMKELAQQEIEEQIGYELKQMFRD